MCPALSFKPSFYNETKQTSSLIQPEIRKITTDSDLSDCWRVLDKHDINAKRSFFKIWILNARDDGHPEVYTVYNRFHCSADSLFDGCTQAEQLLALSSWVIYESPVKTSPDSPLEFTAVQPDGGGGLTLTAPNALVPHKHWTSLWWGGNLLPGLSF